MQEIQMARKTAAYKIHMDIMAAGEVAAEAFSTFCRLLKTMRDDKLYVELEYSSFDAYCENAVGISYRMAFNYIEAYNNFGEENLKSISGLGIRKLLLIGSAPEESREKLLSEAKDMTTREVETAVKEYKSKLAETEEKFGKVNFEKIKLESELKRLNEHVTKTNKYANEHMDRARKAEFELEKKETAMNALRADLQAAKSQLADAKAKGDSDKIKRYEATITEQVDKLEKLEEENGKLQKQLHEKPIEVAAARVVEKEVIPDEIALAIYDKVAKLYEGLLKLTDKEIQIFAAGVDPDYSEEIHEGLRNASQVLKQIDNTIILSQESNEEAAPTSELCGQCGACKNADMDGVTEEQLEQDKTWCKVKEEIVEFTDGCSRYEGL